MRKFYQKFIYMPNEIINIPKKKYSNIFITDHAYDAMQDDNIELFNEVEFSGKDILRAEVINGKLKTILVELPYNETKNICISLCFNVLEIEMTTVYLDNKDNIQKVNIGDRRYSRPKNFSFERE